MLYPFKEIRISVVFLLLVLGGCLQLKAQKEPAYWLKVYGGFATYQGDMNEQGLTLFRTEDLSFGAALAFQPNPYWQLLLDASSGKISYADSLNTASDYLLNRKFHFSTSYTDLSLKAAYYPLPDYQLQPYISTGLGLSFIQPDAFLLANEHPELFERVKQDLEASIPDNTWFIPLEVGLNIPLQERISLSLLWQHKITFTDYLDGVSKSGDAANNDHYGALALGVNFRFNAAKDTDQDGVKDALDDCPLKPGTAATNGCPDSDGDGIRNAEDRCPYAVGKKDLFGCPDTDNDGTADPYDRCPAKAGPPEALGCPITDTDHDGIEDHLDDCPLDHGPPDRNGCPAIDTDLDGILDEDDRCPQLYGIPVFEGCPDEDGDGIEDYNDACPSLFGLFNEQGCPIFYTAEEEAQALSRQNLYFGPNSIVLTNLSLLDRITTFLEQHPSYQLSIRAHADPLGSDLDIESITQQRIEQTKTYLLNNKVAPERISVQLIGGEQPISMKPGLLNQAKNRRIDFAVFE